MQNFRPKQQTTRKYEHLKCVLSFVSVRLISASHRELFHRANESKRCDLLRTTPKSSNTNLQ